MLFALSRRVKPERRLIDCTVMVGTLEFVLCISLSKKDSVRSKIVVLVAGLVGNSLNFCCRFIFLFCGDVLAGVFGGVIISA